MSALIAGTKIIINGAAAVAQFLFSPITLLVVLGVAGLAWMAFIEIEELNRQSYKPEVRYH